MSAELAQAWRTARPEPVVLHLDSAACSRSSRAVLDACAAHARHEAEAGGYVAAQAAEPVLAAGRTAIGALTGMTAADVVYTTGAQHGLDLLLGSWPGARTAVCLPGEFGPNLAVMAAHGFQVSALPVDQHGRLRVAAAADALRTQRPAMVHLTGLGSHCGVVQPIAEMAALCRDLEIPLVLDAAQALGQLDCAVGADAVYSTSRKWLAGPRGVGFLAVRPELAERLNRRVPPPNWPLPMTTLQSFAWAEANIAARVGFSVALGEHLAAGPARVRAGLAAVGRATRAVLAEVAGWQVVEDRDEPSAITTLRPPPGADLARVHRELLAEHAILTTFAEVARAPFALTAPVLRISPHLDVGTADLGLLADALTVLGEPD